MKGKKRFYVFIGIALTLAIIIFLSWLFYQKYNADQTQNESGQNGGTELKDEIKKEKKQLPHINNTTFNIPIYMYHHIQDVADPNDQMAYNLSLSPALFEQEIDYLVKNNYQTVKLEDLKTTSLNKKVALTFDDGYIDIVLYAFPILQKHNLAGTVFIITDFVGTAGYMSWDDLKILSNAGWEIGSHTLTHPDLADLDIASAQNQIEQSKKTIEKNLGVKIKYLCYPAGKFTDETINIVKNNGYAGAVSTIYGKENSINNIYALERIRINGGESLDSFIATLN